MRIREATVSDSAVVASLVLALMEELCRPEPSGYSTQELSRLTTTLLRSKDLTAILAEQNDEPVGILVLNGCASLYAGCFGEITEMYVKPTVRSAAVGEALIAEATRIGQARGWSRLEVGTPEQPAWVRTLAFYKRNGFVETGVRLKLPL